MSSTEKKNGSAVADQQGRRSFSTLAHPALAAAWAFLFVAPSATTIIAAGPGAHPGASIAASLCILLIAWLLLPPRWLLAIGYPFVLLAVACAAAALDRDVNLLELAAQWRTFTETEIVDALRPYAWPFAAAAVVIAVLTVVVSRWSRPNVRPAQPARAGAAAVLALLLLLVPPSDRARAWPANAVLVTLAAVTHSYSIGAMATMAADISPRDPKSDWGAVLRAAPSAQHTNVLVVGETMRADYLRECGGWQKVRAVHAGALVACDVTAGANITTASVPLLVSREMPGHGLRVSGDGTFQRAFDASGFATYWLATQDPSVAWPDAAVRRFQSGPDRMMLLPLLDEALHDGRSRRSIVLHGMGAHSPYCARFDRGTAPYADACDELGDLPSDTTVTRWRAMYANAVDGSIGFLNEVIERLEREKGEAFLVFAADHGENLLDDARRAYGHALREPTQWELHVPLVFWANDAWKATHRHEWAMLRANAARPLMHADVVPTLTAAAGIRYVDTRRLPVNLLARPVPLRERVVQQDFGTATTWEALLRAGDEP